MNFVEATHHYFLSFARAVLILLGTCTSAYGNIYNLGSGELTAEQASEKFEDTTLQDIENNPSIGYKTDGVWIAYKLDKTKHQAEQKQYFLTILNATLNHVLFYEYIPGENPKLLAEEGGLANTGEKYSNNLFPTVELPKQNQGFSGVILARIQSYSPIMVSYRLATKLDLDRSNMMIYVFNGIYFGVFFLLGVYCIFLHRSLRYQFALEYAGFCLAMIIFVLFAAGWLDAFFFDIIDFKFGPHTNLIRLLSPWFALRYSRSFIDCKNHPWIDHVYGLFILINPLLYLACYFSGELEYNLMLEINEALVSIWCLIATAVFYSESKDKPSGVFLASWIFLLIFIVTWFAGNHGVYEHDVITIHTSMTGMIIQALFISFATNMKISSLRQQNESNIYKEAEVNTLDSLVKLLVHDIANPLAIINGQAEVMKRRGTITEAADHRSIESITKASETMNNIIESVRKMSALKSGKIVIETKQTDLKRSIERAIDNISARREQKGVRIITNYVTEYLTPILADPTTLENQVLSNLLSNAVKFSNPEKDIRIEVYQDQSHCVVKIKDSGVGIPKERIKDLFSFTGRTSTRGTGDESGSGFGLPLVKLFLEQYGATINITSTTVADDPKNHGTTATIVFKNFF